MVLKRVTCPALVLAVLLVALFLEPSHAHRVTIFAWVEGETVHTESKFSGGKRVVAGTVEIYEHPSGTRLLSGSTDSSGRFSFPLPQEVRENGSGLRAVILAGMGHQNDWHIPPEEFGGAAGPASTKSVSPGTPSPSGTPPAGPAETEEYRRILEETLDRKLTPLVQRLEAMERSGPGAAEIFGGIGYIVGLLGIGLYLRSRKR
jgi:nickel transport protein